MYLADLTWPDVAALRKDTPVVFPIAAMEQHGRHLPFCTDSLLTGEIARRAEVALGTKALFAPLLWLSNSHHHLDFPGTVSAEPRVYLDLLCGLLDNFIAHGFTRLVLLNGHGGNDVPGRQAVFEIRQRHRHRKDLLLLLITYWNTNDKTSQSHPDLKQTVMGHACEWETSMVLRLAPHLVKDYRCVTPQEPGKAFAPAERGWVMPDRSEHGHVGDPREATAEKGEALLHTFTHGIVEFIERVIAWDGKSWEDGTSII
jgi:creatinine amidohydrolase